MVFEQQNAYLITNEIIYQKRELVDTSTDSERKHHHLAYKQKFISNRHLMIFHVPGSDRRNRCVNDEKTEWSALLTATVEVASEVE